jgi:hypothetical protein
VWVARERRNLRAAAHRSPTTNTKPKPPLRLRDRTTPPHPPRRHSREATAAIGLATPALHDDGRTIGVGYLLHGARLVGRTHGIEVGFLPYLAVRLPRMPLLATSY